MNRNLMIALLVVVLAGGGYWYYAGQQRVAEEAAMAQQAAEEAAAAAKKAEEEAAAAAAEEAAAAAASAATSATELATDLFDPATYDAAKVNAAIDGSTLDDAAKAALKADVDAAKDSPELLKSALDQVKAALGL